MIRFLFIVLAVSFKVTEINGNSYNNKIKPVIGPANYDYNVLWCLTKS